MRLSTSKFPACDTVVLAAVDFYVRGKYKSQDVWLFQAPTEWLAVEQCGRLREERNGDH